MTHLVPRLARKREHGSVAIEAAVCIAFILVPVMAFVLLFGRYFWYYTVAEKAVHDAAIYMANAPLSEIKSTKGSAGLANDIIAWETADLDAGTSATLAPTVLCGYKIGVSTDIQWLTCNASYTPVGIRTGLVMTVTDPFLSPVTNAIWGTDGIPIGAIANLSYVGH